MKNPEKIIKDLQDVIGLPCHCSTCKKKWDRALEEIHIYANHKTCECDPQTRPGATTNWTCHDCGKIVDDIECKLDNFIAA